MSAVLPPDGNPAAAPAAAEAAGDESHSAGDASMSIADASMSGAAGAKGGDAGKGFQRAYKACDACRNRKVRCDLGSVEQPLDPPCRRCRRERRECTFNKGTRGKPKSGPAGASGSAQPYLGEAGEGASSTPTPASWMQLGDGAASAGASAAGASASASPMPPLRSSLVDASSSEDATRQHRSYSTASTSIQQYQQAQAAQQHPYHAHGVPRSHSSGSIHQHAFAHRGSAGSPAGSSASASAAAAAAAEAAAAMAANGSAAGAAGPNGAPGVEGSDTSSPTAHASLALINLRNSSEAMKALTTVGVAEGGDSNAPSPAPAEEADLMPEAGQPLAGAGATAGSGLASRPPVNVMSPASERSAAAGAASMAPPRPPAPPKRKSSSGAAAGGAAGEDAGSGSKARRTDAAPAVHSGRAGASTSAAAKAGASGSSKPRRLRDWRDFEPVRLKIIKASEARYLLKYFFQHIHGFSPLCSERYLRLSAKEARSELIAREPLLLGAILSIASRFCIGPDQDAAANALDRASTAATATSSTTKGVSAAAVAAEKASFGLELHQRISHWTHQLAGRVLVDCSLHSVGSVEALLLLSEWSTWGIHSNRSDMLASDDDDSDEDEEEDEEANALSDGDEAAAHARSARQAEGAEAMDVDGSERRSTMPNGAAANGAAPQASSGAGEAKRKRTAGRSSKRAQAAGASTQRSGKMRSRPSADVIALTTQRFDSMSWMFVGMAIRLAEELDLPRHDKCFGIHSHDPVEVEEAERRLRVWLDCVRADTQISIRLGRRFTSGGLSPEWMELMRARTYQLPDTVADPPVSSNGSSSGHTPRPSEAPGSAGAAAPNGSVSKDRQQQQQHHANSNFTYTDDLVGAARHDPVVNSARKWTAWRGHAELANKLRNVHDMLNESDARTASMMENDRFESILRPFRNDLDSWVRWLEPKIGYPGGGMRTLGIRVDYHFTRLQAFRVALDALVLRARRIGRPDGLAALGEGLSDRPTFPFAKESVDAARTLAIVISVDLQSLRCAPPKFFLYLVLAVMVCMQACELSDALMLPMQCASILREAINALNAVAVDERHLARRYALMLRNAGKRLLHAEEVETATAAANAAVNANASAPHTRGASGHLVSDPKLLSATHATHDISRAVVPTISVAPRPAPANIVPGPAPLPGPSFADDVLAPTQGVDLEDLWSWLGNIDQAVPAAVNTAESVTDSVSENVINFESLYEGQSAPFFFPNTALNQ